MKKKGFKIKIQKCYLVQLVDQDGCEYDWEYVFGDKKQAEAHGKMMLDEHSGN